MCWFNPWKNTWCNASYSISLFPPTPTLALIRFIGLNCNNCINKSYPSSGILLDNRFRNTGLAGLAGLEIPSIYALTSFFSINIKSYSSIILSLFLTSSFGFPNCCKIKSNKHLLSFAYIKLQYPFTTFQKQLPWNISAKTTPTDQISILFVYVYWMIYLLCLYMILH